MVECGWHVYFSILCTRVAIVNQQTEGNAGLFGFILTFEH